MLIFGSLEQNIIQYRLLAFWDKRNKIGTLVIATNGFIKKTKKSPKVEIKRARQIMELYLKTR
jgi:phage-related protein